MNVHEIVRSTIDEMNLRLPRERRLEASADCVLLGDGSSLDSTAFLDLLLMLEQKIEEGTGRQVVLVTDTIFDPASGPLRTVGTLEAYLESLIANGR
jgi:hypothetical protein